MIIEIRDGLQADPLSDREVGPLILLATPAMTAASNYRRMIGALTTAHVPGNLLIIRHGEADPSLDIAGIRYLDWDEQGTDGAAEPAHHIVQWLMAHRHARTAPWLVDDATMTKLLGKISDLPLSPRTFGLLRNQNINYVGDLVQWTEGELLRILGFGRKSLQDVRTALRAIDLRLGMMVPGWPPLDVEHAMQQASAASRVAQLQQARGGARFEPREDQFAMIVEGDLDDRSAASQPITAQMHAAVLEKARSFAGVAQRLDNQPGWTGIGRVAASLTQLLDRPTLDVPDILGLLYPAALEIGSFLELDQQLSQARDAYAAPLDPEMRRPLGDLVRSLAPWLRAFPSVRAMDDDASQFLVQAASLSPAMDVVRSASELQLLSEADLVVFQQLREAADRGAFQAEKAGGRVQRTSLNLVIGAATFAGGFMMSAVSSDYATSSPLVHKAGQFLTRSEMAISQLVADAAPDLQLAIGSFVRELAERPILPASTPQPRGPLPTPDPERPPDPPRRRRSITVN